MSEDGGGSEWRFDVGDLETDAEGLEPGSIGLENALFVVLGVVTTLAAIAALAL